MSGKGSVLQTHISPVGNFAAIRLASPALQLCIVLKKA
jgi:hypothetical protein